MATSATPTATSKPQTPQKLTKQQRKVAANRAAKKRTRAKERERLRKIPSKREMYVWSKSLLFTGHALDRLVERELIIDIDDTAAFEILAAAARSGTLIKSSRRVQHRCIVWHGWFVILVVKVTSSKRVVLTAWAHPSKFASAATVAEFIAIPDSLTMSQLRRHTKSLKRDTYTNESFAVAA